MALSFIDTDGKLIIPGAAAKWETAPANSGIASTGVVIVVGEADTGPDFSSENESLAEATFGPRSAAAVAAKYGKGPIVDAYRILTAPSKAKDIRGAPARVIVVKTNKGTKASLTLTDYAELEARLEGKQGDLISYSCKVTDGKATVTIARKSDSISDSITFGGSVVLQLRAQSANPVAATVTATKLTSAGAAGVAALDLNLADFKTINDLVAYISSQNGWTAKTVPAFGQKSPTIMDQGTVACATEAAGTFPAEVKKDAYDFVQAVNSSRLCKVKTAPTTGLPTQTTLAQFFSGGAKGNTTDQTVIDALAAVEVLRGNFVVPCFSRDATADIADGLTESTSSYTVASIHAALAEHVSKCSQFKRRRPRQGFASIKDTWANTKAAAQTLANMRVACTFQDVLALGQVGLAWFQPWMGAVVAAGMQAAAFYRPIFNKPVAVSGLTHTEFKSTDYTAVEEALEAGLLTLHELESGGFAFVSDQTTYGVDENFVANSIQAIYTADTISMTVAQRMEAAFVGQSFADVSAAVAMSYLKGIMADLKRLKLIVASDDAVEGFKDANIEIRPPAMLVTAEVKAATGIYFIPVRFLITQAQQSARS